jgi:hypothetical protein
MRLQVDFYSIIIITRRVRRGRRGDTAVVAAEMYEVNLVPTISSRHP